MSLTFLPVNCRFLSVDGVGLPGGGACDGGASVVVPDVPDCGGRAGVRDPSGAAVAASTSESVDESGPAGLFDAVL